MCSRARCADPVHRNGSPSYGGRPVCPRRLLSCLRYVHSESNGLSGSTGTSETIPASSQRRASIVYGSVILPPSLQRRGQPRKAVGQQGRCGTEQGQRDPRADRERGEDQQHDRDQVEDRLGRAHRGNPSARSRWAASGTAGLFGTRNTPTALTAAAAVTSQSWPDRWPSAYSGIAATRPAPTAATMDFAYLPTVPPSVICRL